MTTTLLIEITIVLGVILIALGGVIFARKYGNKYIEAATSIAEFIQDQFLLLTKGTDFENKNVNKVIEIIVKTLVFIESAAGEKDTVETKVNHAFRLIESNLTVANIQLNDNEKGIIKTVLTYSFEFMSNIGFSINTNNSKVIETIGNTILTKIQIK